MCVCVANWQASIVISWLNLIHSMSWSTTCHAYKIQYWLFHHASGPAITCTPVPKRGTCNCSTSSDSDECWRTRTQQLSVIGETISWLASAYPWTPHHLVMRNSWLLPLCMCVRVWSTSQMKWGDQWPRMVWPCIERQLCVSVVCDGEVGVEMRW